MRLCARDTPGRTAVRKSSLKVVWSSLVGALAVLAASLVARDAMADDATSKDGTSDAAASKTKKPVELTASEKRRLLHEPEGYIHLFGTLSFGDGLRFNNPYRLSHELGDDAESVSLTAPYVDISAAMLLGPPDSVQNGAALHVGSSLSGPGQTYLSLSYLVGYRSDKPYMVYGRIGPDVILSPDANVGGELAGSFSYFFTGALGLTSELAFDLFYGASTLDKKFTVYPVLSLQLGLVFDFEVLP